MFKKCFSALAILLFVRTSVFGQYECATVIAGKNATADGSVLVGHNEDNGTETASVSRVSGMQKTERRNHATGELVGYPVEDRIPQVETTYAYLWLSMPEPEHVYSDAVLNEFGVCVCSNACRSREDKPDLTDGGIGGRSLRHLVAQRARTAREGVKLVGEMIEKYGYSTSGRTLNIADSNEGWMVAMVNGKHWVAQRVPDDMVAVIANTYIITEVDLADTFNFLGSPDLIEYAVKRGWYNPQDGPFSFEKAYADPKTRVSAGNTHRQWSGLALLSKDTVPLPEAARLPFAVKPKEPLTVNHITRVLRDHYEDTILEPGITYKDKPAHRRHTSTICGPGTNSSHVFQLRSGMPVEVGALWWLALWQPCSTPFMPVYYGIIEVPEQLGFGSEPPPSKNFPPEYGAAYRAFSDLALWVDKDYAERIPAVRKRWQTFEKSSFKLQDTFEKDILEQLKTDPAAAKEMLSRYSYGAVARAVEQAKQLVSEVGEK